MESADLIAKMKLLYRFAKMSQVVTLLHGAVKIKTQNKQLQKYLYEQIQLDINEFTYTIELVWSSFCTDPTAWSLTSHVYSFSCRRSGMKTKGKTRCRFEDCQDPTHLHLWVWSSASPLKIKIPSVQKVVHSSHLSADCYSLHLNKLTQLFRQCE